MDYQELASLCVLPLWFSVPSVVKKTLRIASSYLTTESTEEHRENTEDTSNCTADGYASSNLLHISSTHHFFWGCNRPKFAKQFRNKIIFLNGSGRMISQ